MAFLGLSSLPGYKTIEIEAPPAGSKPAPPLGLRYTTCPASGHRSAVAGGYFQIHRMPDFKQEYAEKERQHARPTEDSGYIGRPKSVALPLSQLSTFSVGPLVLLTVPEMTCGGLGISECCNKPVVQNRDITSKGLLDSTIAYSPPNQMREPDKMAIP
jgi:hypothetical protein